MTLKKKNFLFLIVEQSLKPVAWNLNYFIIYQISYFFLFVSISQISMNVRPCPILVWKTASVVIPKAAMFVLANLDILILAILVKVTLFNL